MKTYLVALKLLVCFVFITCYSCKSTSSVKNNITEDSLFSQIRVLLSRSQWQDAIALNGDYIKSSYQTDDQYGVVLGYINIGNIYHLHSDDKNALLFLNKASVEKGHLEDPKLNARLASEYMIVYSSLNLNYKAREYYNKAFEAASKITDAEKRVNAFYYLYSIRAQFYEDEKQYDSMIVFLHKGLALKQDPNFCIRIAKYFLQYWPNPDSAKLYLDRADSLFAKGNYPPYYKGFMNKIYGDWYDKRGEYDIAISYYLAAADIFKKENSISGLYSSYNALSKACQEKGDMSSSREYLEKYVALSDSLKNGKQKALEISVKDIEEKYEQQYNRGKQKVLWLIIVFSSLLVAVVLFIFRRIRTKQWRTSELLVQKEQEAQALRQKVDNSSFDELMELARQNSPNFYTRFREVYPEWHKKIMEIAPGITLTELTLCAYVYLDFQTKEIAELTSKSVRTIQHGKYIIRKKLKIDSHVDIHLWLKNLDI